MQHQERLPRGRSGNLRWRRKVPWSGTRVPGRCAVREISLNRISSGQLSRRPDGDRRFFIVHVLMQRRISNIRRIMINQNVERMRRSVAHRLGPGVIRTSTVVRSLIAYLVNERWTEPHIVDLRCADDGMLLAYESDANTYLRLLCNRDELIRAVLTLAHLVDLTPAERNYLLSGVPSQHSAKPTPMKEFDDLIKVTEDMHAAIRAKNKEQGLATITCFSILFMRVYGHSVEMVSQFVPRIEEIRELISAEDYSEANLHVLAILAWLRKVRGMLNDE